MFNSIKLKNFRKHEDLDLAFGEGLVVMRAPNEGGKSTVIEAALYALYGARALRDSLDETVTWGKNVNSLEVELTITLQGEMFLFKRSKSGAEINYSGGIVTGQTEVTNFASKLLASRDVADRLMLASQNNIRGALDDGSVAVSGIIEGLADFDLFDRLIEAATSKLLTGSTGVYDTRLEEAKEELAIFEVDEPDSEALDKIRAVNTGKIEALEVDKKVAEEAYTKADYAFKNVEHQLKIYNEIVTRERKASDLLKLHKEQLLNAEAKASVVVDPDSKLDQLRIELDSASQMEEVKQSFEAYTQFITNSSPENVWEGSYQSYRDEMGFTESDIAQLEVEFAKAKEFAVDIKAELRKTEAGIVTSVNCPTCDRPLENHAELLEQNKEKEKEVVVLNSKLSNAEAKVVELKSELAEKVAYSYDLKALEQMERVVFEFAKKHKFVELEDVTYPRKVTWSGPSTTEEVDIASLQAQIKQIEDQKQDVLKATVLVETLTQTVQEDEAYLQDVTAQLDSATKPDGLEQLKTNLQECDKVLSSIKNSIEDLQSQVDEAETNYRNAVSLYERALENKQMLSDRVKQLEADIESIQFNNVLLKKIRAARPLIADKLWTMVLTSVSSMFSEMRGEVSVVSKDKGGFSINGANVASMSGSTKDLLGLAIRCALLKTFLPNLPLLVLDEPGAAMDDDRVTKMLGFLSSIGFQQTLLITHENVSESFANQVVTL